MNLVEYVKEQLSTESAGKLGALIGEGEGKTKAVLAAAVPSLLAAFATLMSNTNGAERLAAAVGKFEPALPGNFKNLTRNEAEAVRDEGNAALESLLTLGTVYAICGTVSRYCDLNVDKVKTLMGYLGALVLGTLGGLQKDQSSAIGLSGLFADQKANLTNAMPAGLSLEQIPGVGKPAPSGGGSLLNVLVALLILAAVAGGAWFVLRPGGLLAPKDGGKATTPTTDQKMPPAN